MPRPWKTLYAYQVMLYIPTVIFTLKYLQVFALWFYHEVMNACLIYNFHYMYRGNQKATKDEDTDKGELWGIMQVWSDNFGITLEFIHFTFRGQRIVRFVVRNHRCNRSFTFTIYWNLRSFLEKNFCHDKLTKLDFC